MLQLWQEVHKVKTRNYLYFMKSLDILMNTETLSRKQRGLSYNNTVENLWCLVFFAVCVLCCHIVGLGWRRCYLLIFANPSQLWGLIPHYTGLVERKMRFYSHKVGLRSFGTVWEVWATREGLCKKYQVVVCFSFHRTLSRVIGSRLLLLLRRGLGDTA